MLLLPPLRSTHLETRHQEQVPLFLLATTTAAATAATSATTAAAAAAAVR